MAKPLTDDERQAIVDLMKAGKSRNEIVQTSGRGGATITRIAREIGHDFLAAADERTQSSLAHAHAARSGYAAERRALVAEGALGRALELVKDFDATQPVVIGGPSPRVEHLELDARGQKDRAQALQLLTRTVLDIARVDEKRDDGPAKGLLERIVDALEDDQDDVA